MPVFNVGAALGVGKKAKGSGTGYNALVDLLSIRENELASDGKLSPGDIDLLVSEARKLRNNPSLSDDQRSNIDVKISGYQKQKSVDQINDGSNVGRMNRDIADDNRANTMLVGNNPSAFVQLRSRSLYGKLDQLKNSIDTLEAAGADSSSQMMEYSKTLTELQDVEQAKNDMAAYDGGDKPSSDMVAFISTNSKGEITGVDIGRFGANQGYLRTNALYGGLQVYGRPNGENKFVLGNNQYHPVDIMKPDPSNPLAPSYKILLSDDTADRNGIVSSGQIGTFKPLDTNTLRTQSFVDKGGWAEGLNGTLYQANGDGTYRKYVNVKDRSKLEGFDQTSVLPVPSNMESIFSAKSTSTFDDTSFETGISDVGSSALYGPPAPPGVNPVTPPTQNFPASARQIDTSVQGPGSSRTPAPATRSPGTAIGYAGQTIDKAKGFLGRIFG